MSHARTRLNLLQEFQSGIRLRPHGIGFVISPVADGLEYLDGSSSAGGLEAGSTRVTRCKSYLGLDHLDQF
jgi:hypothetical protein